MPLSPARIVLDSLPMQGILRTAVLCLLLLTVPMQGFAAVTKLFCEHTHHSYAAERSGHLENSSKVLSLSFTEKHLPSRLPHQHHHCVVCAACCMTVAMMPEVSTPEAPPPGSYFFSLSAAHLYGVRPDTLDRPPRMFLV